MTQEEAQQEASRYEIKHALVTYAGANKNAPIAEEERTLCERTSNMALMRHDPNYQIIKRWDGHTDDYYWLMTAVVIRGAKE